MSTTFYTNPIFLKHDTGDHPERIDRLSAILAMKERYLPHLPSRSTRGIQIASVFAETHAASQIDAAEQIAIKGGGFLDPDTPMSVDSFAAATIAGQVACEAVDDVMQHKTKRAFCALRPPGHHATENQSMGFCIFNNVALAANYARRVHHLERILIVDWDVHHGNGTQDIFYQDSGVYFFSMHRSPFYPGSGAEHETGTGAGAGYTRNLPVADGTPRGEILSAFAGELHDICNSYKPELILISAGFDAHAADPIGSLGLESEDFSTLTTHVRQAADTYAKGRIVSLLEGGYNLEMLAESVRAHLESL